MFRCSRAYWTTNRINRSLKSFVPWKDANYHVALSPTPCKESFTDVQAIRRLNLPVYFMSSMSFSSTSGICWEMFLCASKMMPHLRPNSVYAPETFNIPSLNLMSFTASFSRILSSTERKGRIFVEHLNFFFFVARENQNNEMWKPKCPLVWKMKPRLAALTLQLCQVSLPFCLYQSAFQLPQFFRGCFLLAELACFTF